MDSVEQPELRISSEPAGTRVVRLTVEVPEERVQQQMVRTARGIAQRTSIPGFRKGKVPYAIILQRFGEAAVRQEAADILAQEAFREALEKEDIVPYRRGSLEDVQLEPLCFTFTVPLIPVVELGDYRAIRVPPPPVEVAPDEVANVLTELQRQNAILEPAERPARVGDALRVTVEGRGDDGQVFLQDSDAEVLLDPQDDYPAPGFYPALEGMEVGQTRSFRLKMPGGRPVEEVEFTVELLSLFDRTLPRLDDDLARTVGNFDSLEALKQDVEEKIRAQKRQEADKAYAQQVIEAAVWQSKVEFPPDVVEEEIDRVQKQFADQVQRERRMNLADFLKVTGKSEREWRDAVRPQVEERLRRSLVLTQLISESRLEVSDEEIDQRIARISEAWGNQAERVREQMQGEEGRRNLASNMLVEKVTARLVAIARGEDVPDEPKEEEESA